jgi:integrase
MTATPRRDRWTDLAVKNIKPPTDRPQVDHWDPGTPRFGLRVGRKGTKTWIIIMRPSKGANLVRRKIGRYPAMSLADAREAADKALKLVDAGVDPAKVKQAQSEKIAEDHRNTFKAVAERFVAMKKKASDKPRTEAERERALLRDPVVVKMLHDMPVSSITKRQVTAVLDAVAERGPIAANRTFAYLRGFFGWCVERDAISQSPCLAMKKPSKEVKRQRTLTASEIAEVWRAFDGKGGMFGAMFKMLMLTGARRDEIAGLRWDELKGLRWDRREGKLVEIAGEAPAIELPGQRTKNGLPHVIPLAPQAMTLLQSIPRKEITTGGKTALSPYVFTETGKTHATGYSNAVERVHKLVAKAREAAGIEEPMPEWRLHDVRRSVASGMARIGVQPAVIEAALNHVSGLKGGIAGVYVTHDYLEERRAALKQWADHIEEITKPPADEEEAPAEPANVVAIARTATSRKTHQMTGKQR